MKTIPIKYFTKKLVKEYINRENILDNIHIQTFSIIFIEHNYYKILHIIEPFYLLDDGNRGFYLTLNQKIINHFKNGKSTYQ
jgi:hypothetical protein